MAITQNTSVKLPAQEWLKLIIIVGTAVATGAWYMRGIESEVLANKSAIGTNASEIGEMASAINKLTIETTKVVSKLEAATPAEILSEVRALKIPTTESIDQMITLRLFKFQERLGALESRTVDRLYRYEIREWIADLKDWLRLALMGEVPDDFPEIRGNTK